MDRTVTAGTLAYYDSFTGLVPVRVDSVKANDDDIVYVRFTVTASRHGYPQGEQWTTNASRVIARDTVRRRNGRYRIIASSDYYPDSE